MTTTSRTDERSGLDHSLTRAVTRQGPQHPRALLSYAHLSLTRLRRPRTNTKVPRGSRSTELRQSPRPGLHKRYAAHRASAPYLRLAGAPRTLLPTLLHTIKNWTRANDLVLVLNRATELLHYAGDPLQGGARPHGGSANYSKHTNFQRSKAKRETYGQRIQTKRENEQRQRQQETQKLEVRPYLSAPTV